MATCTDDNREVLDDGKIYVYTDDDGTNHYREGRPFLCGDSDSNGHDYCHRHKAELRRRYPQGWSYYPGDICPHGMYTGGIGIDHMCQRCESE